jgi:hypothetical protein
MAGKARRAMKARLKPGFLKGVLRIMAPESLNEVEQRGF